MNSLGFNNELVLSNIVLLVNRSIVSRGDPLLTMIVPTAESVGVEERFQA